MDFKKSISASMRPKFLFYYLGIKNYACNKCDYRGRDQIDLRRHIMSRHIAASMYPCQDCDERFSNIRLLKVFNFKFKKNHDLTKNIFCGEYFPLFSDMNSFIVTNHRLQPNFHLNAQNVTFRLVKKHIDCEYDMNYNK